MIQDRVELIVNRPEIGRRKARAVFFAHGAHEVLPEQYVLRGELFDECFSQIRLDLVSEENDFVLPGARSDCRFDVTSIDSEELGEGQGPDIRLGFEPSLPFLRFFFGIETSFGRSLGRAVRIFETA